VQHVVDAEVRHVHVDGVGDVARLAADFDLAGDLLQHAAAVRDADRLADEVQRHGHFDLLAAHEPAQVCVDEAAAQGIDLAVEEHHLGRADAVDVEREDAVVARLGAQDRGQLAQGGCRRDRLAAAAVDGERDVTARAQTPRVVLAAARPLLALHRDLLSLCHGHSSQKSC
jgi:hypothetical protein